MNKPVRKKIDALLHNQNTLLWKMTPTTCFKFINIGDIRDLFYFLKFELNYGSSRKNSKTTKRT